MEFHIVGQSGHKNIFDVTPQSLKYLSNLITLYDNSVIYIELPFGNSEYDTYSVLKLFSQ